MNRFLKIGHIASMPPQCYLCSHLRYKLMPIFNWGYEGKNHKVFLKPEILVLAWVTASFSQCWARHPGPSILGKVLYPELRLDLHCCFHLHHLKVWNIFWFYLEERGKCNIFTEFLKMAFSSSTVSQILQKSQAINVCRCLRSSQRWKGNEEDKGTTLYLIPYLGFYS